ncbi:hypothetical protein [Nonomuraea sp. NPDC049758]|uniref:hypothetical protein n=1 Tax=Nonomuraea sp. NPDC049758 TaxID=3154360 RepID=UPI0034308181
MEADFWGGSGSQAAALWENGRRSWGPEHASIQAGPPRDDWPINAVLARLGAVRAGAADLFDAVGLGRERDMEGWRRAALDAPGYDAWEAACRAREEADARAAAERDRYTRRDDVPVVLDGRTVMRMLGLPPSPIVGPPSGISRRFTWNAVPSPATRPPPNSAAGPGASGAPDDSRCARRH